MVQNTESARLEEARSAKVPWRKWGPYLSERQWGTVREDYSQDGNAWDYFTTIRPDPGHTTGGRMVLPASAMRSSCSVSAWPCGMAKTPSSKNDCSV